MNYSRILNQVVFVIDSTASMHMYYEEIYNHAIKPVMKYFEKKDNATEFAVIRYFNYPPYSDKVVKISQFQKGVGKCEDFLKRIRFKGGGDDAVLHEGLVSALVNLEWSLNCHNKICFAIFGDHFSLYHLSKLVTKFIDKDMRTILPAFATSNIHLNFVFPRDCNYVLKILEKLGIQKKKVEFVSPNESIVIFRNGLEELVFQQGRKFNDGYPILKKHAVWDGRVDLGIPSVHTIPKKTDIKQLFTREWPEIIRFSENLRNPFDSSLIRYLFSLCKGTLLQWCNYDKNPSFDRMINILIEKNQMICVPIPKMKRSIYFFPRYLYEKSFTPQKHSRRTVAQYKTNHMLSLIVTPDNYKSASRQVTEEQKKSLRVNNNNAPVIKIPPNQSHPVHRNDPQNAYRGITPMMAQRVLASRNGHTPLQIRLSQFATSPNSVIPTNTSKPQMNRGMNQQPANINVNTQKSIFPNFPIYPSPTLFAHSPNQFTPPPQVGMGNYQHGIPNRNVLPRNVAPNNSMPARNQTFQGTISSNSIPNRTAISLNSSRTPNSSMSNRSIPNNGMSRTNLIRVKRGNSSPKPLFSGSKTTNVARPPGYNMGNILRNIPRPVHIPASVNRLHHSNHSSNSTGRNVRNLNQNNNEHMNGTNSRVVNQPPPRNSITIPNVAVPNLNVPPSGNVNEMGGLIEHRGSAIPPPSSRFPPSSVFNPSSRTGYVNNVSRNIPNLPNTNPNNSSIGFPRNNTSGFSPIQNGNIFIGNRQPAFTPSSARFPSGGFRNGGDTGFQETGFEDVGELNGIVGMDQRRRIQNAPSPRITIPRYSMHTLMNLPNSPGTSRIESPVALEQRHPPNGTNNNRLQQQTNTNLLDSFALGDDFGDNIGVNEGIDVNQGNNSNELFGGGVDLDLDHLKFD